MINLKQPKESPGHWWPRTRCDDDENNKQQRQQQQQQERQDNNSNNFFNAETIAWNMLMLATSTLLREIQIQQKQRFKFFQPSL